MNGIEIALNRDKVFVGKTKGDSMSPMLTNGDTVVITPPVFPLKKYDVPVYRRDGHYTMHRVVWVNRHGYVICGDNRVNLERDITDSDIVGVLTSFYHGEKCVTCADAEYIKYSKKICRNYPVRWLRHILKRAIKILKNT